MYQGKVDIKKKTVKRVFRINELINQTNNAKKRQKYVFSIKSTLYHKTPKSITNKNPSRHIQTTQIISNYFPVENSMTKRSLFISEDKPPNMNNMRKR